MKGCFASSGRRLHVDVGTTIDQVLQRCKIPFMGCDESSGDLSQLLLSTVLFINGGLQFLLCFPRLGMADPHVPLQEILSRGAPIPAIRERAANGRNQWVVH
jgi:hypothetical protein